MINTILKKENGKVVTLRLTPELLKIVNNKEELHLCGENCKNADIFNCPKVADINKKTIDKYDNVTDGSQVFDSKGEMVSFKVTGCYLYEQGKDKQLTRKEKQRQKQLTESLKNYHFETSDVNEAHIKQFIQMIDGQIVHAEDKVLPDNVIVSLMIEHPNKEYLLKKYLEYRRKKPFERYTDTIQNAIIRAEKELAKIREAKEYKEGQKKVLIKLSSKKNV